MTNTLTNDTGRSTDIRTDRDTALRELAAGVGREIAGHARRHDEDGTFVEEGLALVRERGLLALAVPQELGGLGATLRQVTLVQRELAKYCGSTALATSMHQHVTAFVAWRHRRGLPGAEATLRRIVADGIVLVSTGGADLTAPRGEAVKVDGGYRVSGRKIFASQSTHGTVLSTMFAYQDPDQGRRVLNVAVPIGADGVTVLGNWDTLGMRGTASNDILIEDVFVPEQAVLANRPWGMVDPPLQVILSIAMPIISGVYLGIAEGALASVLESVGPRADRVLVQRQIGLMEHRVQVADWALAGASAVVGDDPAPSLETLRAVMIAKREVALGAQEVCDLAMDVVGGQAFFKGHPVERAYRDVRAAKFHPFSPELTLAHTGSLALGLPVDELASVG
ncbi:acyl-CoA dehydrogenase family protein [Nocardioides houyundeii]|uniref:acyl-CoA dehydrogenase family protein n=1 Tax=Nocardioides houyundeii TaxID=2045452 RepID=UPI000C764D35|nr:acyl-CoA dehydrogenase family protein [Nocardioides houyundeii]